MPSTTSSDVSMLLASSTVIAPSLPTLSIASAMIFPIVSSLFAEMVPTWATMLPLTGFDIFFTSAVSASTACSIPALDVHRVRAGRDVLRALSVDRLGEHGGGCGAITGRVRRLARDLAHHLRAHVFQRILEVDFLGDSDTILRDGRRTVFLVEDDVAAFWTKGHLDRVGQLVDAA